MPQIGFALSEAHQALDEFLAEHQAGGQPYERWVSAGEDTEQSDVAAYIVPADEYGKMRDGYASWLESQEVTEDNGDLPPGYRPWQHSPLATTERLLPTEPLKEPLAGMMFEKPWADLAEDEQSQVTYTAIACLLRVTLDPDGQGAVPILSVGHSPDEPGAGLRWQIAFRTEVPGLFTRVTANGFFGEEWAILTGSGYVLRSGFLARADAEGAAEALGRTLPNTDWMRLGPDDYTPRARQAVAAVLKRHHLWGVDDNQPEPEVMPDPVPAAAAPGSPAAGGPE